MNEYVYFVRAENSHVKIGRTAISPEQRLKQLQTGSPQILTLEAVIETPCSISLERELHDKFSDKRVRGEWFDISTEEVKSLVREEVSKETEIWNLDELFGDSFGDGIFYKAFGSNPPWSTEKGVSKEQVNNFYEDIEIKGQLIRDDETNKFYRVTMAVSPVQEVRLTVIASKVNGYGLHLQTGLRKAVVRNDTT